MKKERIAVLCICAVLLGTMYAQWIAWACHLMMPSTSLPVGSIGMGGISPSGCIVDFMSAGWPPVGFVLAEIRRMNDKPEGTEARRAAAAEAGKHFTLQTLKPGK